MGLWVAVVVALLLAYSLSFGPACHFAGTGLLSGSRFETAYRPCLDLAIDGPPLIRAPLRWWVKQCGGELNLLFIEVDRLMPPPVHRETFD